LPSSAKKKSDSRSASQKHEVENDFDQLVAIFGNAVTLM